MAITEVYVDPSIAANSGAGTIGDPYGDLEYAIVQTTFDTTNGTRFNVKAGTAEVLANELTVSTSDISVSPAYVYTESARLVIQGYTSVAGDGGIATITCTIFIGPTGDDFFVFKDLDITGNTSNSSIAVIDVDNYCVLQGCSVVNQAGPSVLMDLSAYVADCYLEGTAGNIINTLNDGLIIRTVIVNTGGTNAMSLSNNNVVQDCIIISSSTTGTGINVGGAYSVVKNCSFYSSVASTGTGIQLANAGEACIDNNIVEGWSGTGAVGIGIQGASNAGYYSVQGNAVYNCTTAYDISSGAYAYSPIVSADNETLSVSAFTDAANNDFSPVDTGNVKEGALPQIIGGSFL